jgi:MOSC domain-containing protein
MAGERLEECTMGARGIPGDRGWALRDEKSSEITNGKRIPLLMECAAAYRVQPTGESVPDVNITLPDGSLIRSDDAGINARLSAVLGKTLTLWPLQPASNKTHYRRAQFGSRLAGRLSQFSAFRAALPALTSFGNMNAQLREIFSREPSEPIPDISILPPELLEFTSPPGTYFDAFPVQLLTTASLATLSQLNPQAIWDSRRFRPNFLIKAADQLEGLPEATWQGHTMRIGNVALKCEIPTARCGMTTHAQADLPKDPSVLRTIVREANQNLGVYASVVTPGTISRGARVELFP